MSFETPHRGQSATPGTGVRPSFESIHPNIPAPTPLSPVAQSVDHKSSGRSPSLAQPDHEEPDQQHDQFERPSLNRNRSSWRSGRTQSWGMEENDDRSKNIAKSYRAINSHDFAPPASKFAQSKEYTDPSYDHRFSYYDHPYYNYPYHGPPPPQNGPPPPQASSIRGGPPRASWRSSATAAPPPSRASRVPMKAASAASANSRAGSRGPSRVEEPSESESEDEPPAVQQQVRAQQQQPLTWGYDDMSQITAQPQTQEVIMRLPFSDWMNSGLRARKLLQSL
jgi:hypothetical protein